MAAQAEFPPLKHPVRTFLRFTRFLLPYWDKVLLVLLGVMLAPPLVQVSQLVNRALIDQVILNETASAESRLSMMLVYMVILAALLWGVQLVERMSDFFGSYIQMFVTMDLRRLFYRHLHRLPYQFFQDRPVGEHIYRALEDIRADVFPASRGIVDMVTTNVKQAFATLNSILWQGAVVIALDPMTAVFAVATLLPTTLVSYRLNTRIKRQFLRLKQEEQAVPAVLRDSIAGVETVKGYGRQRYFTLVYVRQFIAAVRAGLGRDYLTLATEQLALWVLDLVAVGSLWTYLVYRLMIGEITFGTYGVIMAISYRLLAPFKALLVQWMNIRQQLVPTQRVLETLDVEPAIQDRPDARAMPRVQGRIRFENVSFAYDPAVPVLRDVTFEVAPGQSVGIVGRSGAGKTTILNLLLRLHRPDSGRILVDDHDLDGIRIADWQDQMSIVLQSTFIFGGDVAYNVRYGKLDATDEEIHRALEMSESAEFVAAMPEGIHSSLAEGGNLSGGQKQRLGIARALVRQPRVLILDEPTSSLDPRTENEIWRSFERAIQGTTTVIVSHRLSTVRKADMVLVLDRGTIIERGTHDELVARGGTYARMWSEQTGGGA